MKISKSIFSVFLVLITGQWLFGQRACDDYGEPLNDHQVSLTYSGASLCHDDTGAVDPGDSQSWYADPNLHNAGYLVNGPRTYKLHEGSGKAFFRIKIDDNHGAAQVLNMEVIDYTDNKVLSSRVIWQNEFVKSDEYQEFELHFSLEGKLNHLIQPRLYWNDTKKITIKEFRFTTNKHLVGTPRITNKSSSSSSHVDTLVNNAITGLGFSAGGYDEPNMWDLIFVGKYYIAWIDQTGFYGKLNGLWLLNGLDGDSLDFVQKEGTRPYNFLAIGEKGDGDWPIGYAGAEHYEIPSSLNEGNDLCLTEVCNWYSIDEANMGSDPDFKWWSECATVNRQPWGQYNAPIEALVSGDTFTVKSKALVKKLGDADEVYDQDWCNTNMLFLDGIRRPVYLLMGYKFYGDEPYFDRTYQYYNEVGNPDFGFPQMGGWSIIHGIAITKYANDFTSKINLADYIYPNETFYEKVRDSHVDVKYRIKDQIYLPKKWRYINPDLDLTGATSGDDEFSWARQSYTLSSNASFDVGKSIHMAHIGDLFHTVLPDINGATGHCVCTQLGCLEIGGGMLPFGTIGQEGGGGITGSIAGGKYSVEGVKRIGFPQGTSMKDIVNKPSKSFEFKQFETENDTIIKAPGHDAIAEGIRLTTASHNAAHVIYGPVPQTYLGNDTLTVASVQMKIDNYIKNSNTVVATIEVYDITTNTLIASRHVEQGEFPLSPSSYQYFSVIYNAKEYNETNISNDHIVVRVYWWDNLNLNIDKVSFYNKPGFVDPAVAKNGNGKNVQTTPKEVIINTPVLTVFQPPNQDVLNVKLGKVNSFDKEIELITLLGKSVKLNTSDQYGSTYSYDVSGLSSGVYIYKVKINGKSFTGKVVID
ncbi:T9SS type A sorting domain-containing protein [Flavivirga spongiicola]|uniref:T9SS type A sorting domain-containing protein n=1 Tax=Flavivirga spongiicola TaxID=421621 RepID=A0ABU7XQT6_9FLAO|nr:T9SS type A sorting domain-containing protein [Flavivirga sp. MEBiC05379]MDO5977896.1 T9SS type A sorting domain-containing protein [Flavivirga sp. MEBiC05379]